MRLATMISLGASAALGLGALVVAKVWLPDGQGPSSAVADRPAGVPVVVAVEPLGYGVRLEAKHLAVAEYPANAAPEGAFTSIQQVLEHDEGAPAVLTPIALREPLLPSKVTGPGARPTIAAMITDGMRAYTVRVTDIAGVGGHALPGDRVDVLLMRNLSTDKESSRLVTDVVLQNVRLLGVDLNADPSSATPAAPRSATLEVSMEDAQRLSMATELGSLSLALRRQGSDQTEIMRPILASELGIVGATVRRSPSRAEGVQPAIQYVPVPAASPQRSPAPPARRTAPRTGVVVVHGDSSVVSEVPSHHRGGA